MKLFMAFFVALSLLATEADACWFFNGMAARVQARRAYRAEHGVLGVRYRAQHRRAAACGSCASVEAAYPIEQASYRVETFPVMKLDPAYFAPPAEPWVDVPMQVVPAAWSPPQATRVFSSSGFTCANGTCIAN